MMLYGYVDRQPQLPNGDAMLTLARITKRRPRPAHIHAQSPERQRSMAHPTNVNGQRLKNPIGMIT